MENLYSNRMRLSTQPDEQSIISVSPVRGLRGDVHLPGDKSIAHRAAIFGALAEGESTFDNFPDAQDPATSVACLEKLGVQSDLSLATFKVAGKGRYGFHASPEALDARNSGTTMRLFAGFLAGQPFKSEITGDESLIKRPMRRVIEPLNMMGARISGSERGTAPLHISGSKQPLRSIRYEMPVFSAQVKSAVLLAGLFADGTTTVVERQRTRDHTERMLRLPVRKSPGGHEISIASDMVIRPLHMTIPGDPSSAAFFIVAALIIPDSDLVIRNISLNPTRIAYVHVLRSMGGDVQILSKRENETEEIGDIRARSSRLKGVTLQGEEIPLVIDELPILAVAGASAEGLFTVKDAEELRNKESDRIANVVNNLRAMGIDAHEFPDGFSIRGGTLRGGAGLDSYGDHRLSMAAVVSAMAGDRESMVKNYQASKVSFPRFLEILNSLKTS